MGYPVAYRTSAARSARQLSRPEAPRPNPRGPANDNKPFPLKPANENFPGRLPPRVDKLIARPAVKRAAQAVMMAHPLLRVLSLLWKLYDLYDWLKVVKTTTGDYNLLCSVDLFGGCFEDLSVPCGWNYCIGPTFDRGITAPCGIAGQAGYGGIGWFNNATFWDGMKVYMHRPNFGGLCHPGRLVQVYGRKPGVGSDRTPGLIHPPQMVRWTRTVPPPWAPFRFYKPEVLMKPAVDYDVPPLPPPYWHIPDREMGNSERGNSLPDTAVETVAPPYAWRGPPPRGTKEKKVKWSGPAQILNAILVSLARADGKLKDLRDIVGAMNDALPKELKLKGKDAKSLPKLLRNVWDNLDKMNGEQALANIIKELAEDVVGGFGDRLRQDAAKEFGWVKSKIFTSPRF